VGEIKVTSQEGSINLAVISASIKKSSQIENYLLYLHPLIIIMERIFAKSTLRTYWKKHSDSEQYLKTWYDTAMSSEWRTPNDVKQTYINASNLKDNRIVFNIKGNSYRLVAKFNFEKRWFFIRFIGTHGEYDKIDVNTV